MINDITALDFPKYASLNQATVSIADMGEKTITSPIKIDGEITPDFSKDWEVVFQDEKYIMPLRTPQGAKENTSLYSAIDLTFQHWAIYQLKRWMFFTVQPVESGTAIADKYIASVSLNLHDFCDLFGQVLQYYFNGAITIDLNPDWEYKPEPTFIEISYTHLWDVLIKFYELFAVRWVIEPHKDNDNRTKGAERYVIRVGYPAAEISHILEYGFDGGLLKIERQVQDENIRNMLLGRGGEKNVPYRYFKDVDPQNPSFPADPDWIPELRNIYFSELRGKTFRDYVRGWKTNPNRQLKEEDGTPICPYDSKIPISLSPYDPDYAKESFAYELGHTDEKFNPVEYVKDDGSIKRYGPLLDGLENNEEIYPSIQGVVVDGLGRIDQTVAIEEITSDDIDKGAEAAANKSNVGKTSETAPKVPKNGGIATIELIGDSFSVEKGMEGVFYPGEITLSATVESVKSKLIATLNELGGKISFTVVKETSSSKFDKEELLVIESITGDVVNVATQESHSWSGIPEGTWRYRIKVKVKNGYKKKAIDITASCENPMVISATPTPEWTNTWDIWVKNIWGSEKRPGESDTAYAERIWVPILGDRTGNSAKIVFSDGWLSTSEDYEFVIAKTPVLDTSRTIEEKDKNGNVIATYPSHWKITLGKCDADLESTGLYLPSTQHQAEAGDHFFFVGIDMPHQYVLWAEERLDAYKTDQLNEIKDIKPTFVVTTDRVRLNNGGKPDALIRQLRAGSSIRLADKRFITTEDENGVTIPSSAETLYIQSITYTYREPSSSDAALNPDVEIVLSDKYETVANPVATIQGEVDSLSRQLGSISNVEQIVRAIGDKLYLRKDGLPDRSMSPTEFSSLLTSLGFRSGIVGGKGWGFFKDENGNWVLEADRVNVRQDMQVNNLVINQIESRAGMIVESAAQITVTRVVEHPDYYICYFDQKNGSVANLFQVDDVALCSRFTPENGALKSYKMRVIAVSAGSIILTKGYAPVPLPDGTIDTGVNGDGEPEEGDVIVHYGNYRNPSRQYVKVRDVINGGYERYIEGLDSVNTDGVEYYFVGRQAEMYNNRPRFYLGDEKGYIEWVNGELNIKGRLSVDSLIGDKTIEDFFDMEIGTRNLLLNSNGPFSTFITEEEESETDTAFYLHDVSTSIELIQGEVYTIRAKADGVWTNDHIGSVSSAPNDNVTIWLFSVDNDKIYQLVSTSSTGSEKGTTFTWRGPTTKAYIRVNSYGKSKTFREIMLVKGNVITTEYTAAPEDFNYITEALKQSTSVEGGLVQTSMIKLGYTGEDGFYHTKAGTSGLYNSSMTGGGIAFWGGGEQIDAEDDPVNGATFVVRMDGSAYAARNTIRFKQNEIEVGDYVTLDADGLKLFNDKEHTEERLSIANTTVGSEADIMNSYALEIDHSETLKLTVVGQHAGTIISRAVKPTVPSSTGSVTVIGSDTSVFEIGDLSDGSSIQATVTCAFPWLFSVTPDGLISGNSGGILVAEIIRPNEEVVATYTGAFRPQTNGVCMAKFDINKAVDAGKYLLRVRSALDLIGDLPSNAQTISSTLHVKGRAKIGMSKKTKICTDGLVSTWDNSVLMVKDNYALLRVGGYGIRITSDGIKIIRDNKESDL